MHCLELQFRRESWRLNVPFRISREIMTHTQLIVAELGGGEIWGRGECCPVKHYGESVDSVLGQLTQIAQRFCEGESWEQMHDDIAPGAARNAVDCAHWDWRSKHTGKHVWELLGMQPPRAVETVYTIGLDTSERMAAAALAANRHGILKVKLGSSNDSQRIIAVRRAVPDARLIVDVNEAWDLSTLKSQMPVLVDCGIEMLEQPLPAADDERLADLEHLVPIGADESCHTSSDLEHVSRYYEVINIKLDKTGGLTEAMRLVHGGRALGLELMVGCMLGTSLAMAPGLLVAQFAHFVDLDAPLLIGQDRVPGLSYSDGVIEPADRQLWG